MIRLLGRVGDRALRMCYALIVGSLSPLIVGASCATLLRLLAHASATTPPRWVYVERWPHNALTWLTTHPDTAGTWLAWGLLAILALALLAELAQLLERRRSDVG